LISVSSISYWSTWAARLGAAGLLVVFSVRGAHVDRAVRLRLHDVHERLLEQLEHGEESHGDAHTPFAGVEERREIRVSLRLELDQDVRHALAYGQRLAAHVMMRKHLRALERLAEYG